MMTSQVSKSVDFTKTQTSRYLKNETLNFLQIKKFIDYKPSANLPEVTFNNKCSFICFINLNTKIL